MYSLRVASICWGSAGGSVPHGMCWSSSLAELGGSQPHLYTVWRPPLKASLFARAGIWRTMFAELRV